MKLYGKELDDEIAKRKLVREERLNKRLTLRNAAKERNISASELVAYESGHDICDHEEWEDQAGGFPMPKLIFKVCKKCGKVDETTTEKVSDANMERVYEIYKRLYPKEK